MLQEAIDRYHALLDETTAHDSWRILNEEMRARQLFFGDRPLATVLRPRLMSEAHYAQIQQGTATVVAALNKIAAQALADDAQGAAVREVLMLTPHEQALVKLDPGYAELSAHSRMDTFLTVDGRSLQFVEYNAESPAAIAYEDLLSEAFLAMPIMQAFAKEYRVRSLPARQRMVETLLGAWNDAGQPGGQPSIAIVDWYDLPTATEFVMFRDYFAEQQIPTVICSPDDLRFRDGRLYATPRGGSEVAVNIIFKRVLTSELLVHYGEHALEHPLVQAYAAGAIVLVNSFRAKLLHKKSTFALLSDPQFTTGFAAETQAALAAHIPWTRVVKAGHAEYQGDMVDLLDFTRRNRERLLLKPNDEYGGKGITIGWECSEADWEAALAAALTTPFVVQERVEIAYEPYPMLVDGQVVIGQRLVDSDPYLFGQQVDGCLCRLSTVTLLNVTAGGGSTVPVFVIERAE